MTQQKQTQDSSMNALLTQTQRKKLQSNANSEQLSPKSRQRLRERLQASLSDIQILLNNIDEKDISMAVDDPDSLEPLFRFYLSALTTVNDTVNIEDTLSTVIESEMKRASDELCLAKTDISIEEYDRETQADNAREKIQSGNQQDLSHAEILSLMETDPQALAPLSVPQTKEEAVSRIRDNVEVINSNLNVVQHDIVPASMERSENNPDFICKRSDEDKLSLFFVSLDESDISTEKIRDAVSEYGGNQLVSRVFHVSFDDELTRNPQVNIDLYEQESKPNSYVDTHGRTYPHFCFDQSSRTYSLSSFSLL
jgi:hypothetical protein